MAQVQTDGRKGVVLDGVMWEQVYAMVEKLKDHPTFVGANLKSTAVVRMAMTRGLRELEKEL